MSLKSETRAAKNLNRLLKADRKRKKNAARFLESRKGQVLVLFIAALVSFITIAVILR